MTSYISEYIQDKLAEYHKYEHKSARLRSLLTDLAMVAQRRDHKTIIAINNMLGGAIPLNELANAYNKYVNKYKDFNPYASQKPKEENQKKAWDGLFSAYNSYLKGRISKYSRLSNDEKWNTIKAEIEAVKSTTTKPVSRTSSPSRLRADGPEFKPKVNTAATTDIDAIIDEMTEKLNSLATAQFEEISSYIDNMTETLKTKETAHKEEVNALNVKINELKTNADEASKTQITELEGKLETVNQEKEAQIESHKKEIEKITKKLGALRDVLDKKEGEINNQKDTILDKLKL
jgi:chromosome segregation ATPase